MNSDVSVQDGPGLFVAVGRELVQYDLDLSTGAVVERGFLTLPGVIEYASPHPHLGILYVSCSDLKPGDDPGRQWACAVRLDQGSGHPSMLGLPVELRARAIHLTVDRAGAQLLLAHHRPAGLSVVKLAEGGAFAEVLAEQTDLDFGVFPHQVRVSPSGSMVFLVARGVPDMSARRPATARQLRPGMLATFGYSAGHLSEQVTLTLGDGLSFGPRNLDFHPTGLWVYLALETQNELLVYQTDADGRLHAEPRQRVSTLANPEADVHQGVGPILMHPLGHVVYVANRCYEPQPIAHRRAIPEEGENSIVVFAVDPVTGDVTLLQRVDSAGVCPRVLSLDATGRILAVANSETYLVLDAQGEHVVPRNVATFAVQDDGRLAFAHQDQINRAPEADIAWVGIVGRN